MKTSLFAGKVTTVGKDGKEYVNDKMAVVGRVVRDPFVGEKSVSIDLATVAKEAEFLRVIFTWEKQREVAEKWLKKGAMVAVVGNHQIETYPKKDGSGDGQRDVIFADNFQICQFAKNENEEAADKPKDDFKPAGVVEDDDLPF